MPTYKIIPSGMSVSFFMLAFSRGGGWAGAQLGQQEQTVSYLNPRGLFCQQAMGSVWLEAGVRVAGTALNRASSTRPPVEVASWTGWLLWPLLVLCFTLSHLNLLMFCPILTLPHIRAHITAVLLPRFSLLSASSASPPSPVSSAPSFPAHLTFYLV